jgi:hypothetical protein
VIRGTKEHCEVPCEAIAIRVIIRGELGRLRVCVGQPKPLDFGSNTAAAGTAVLGQRAQKGREGAVDTRRTEGTLTHAMARVRPSERFKSSVPLDL